MDVNFKTYNVKQGQYGGIIDSTITIPDGLKLITSDDLGPFIHTNNKHYLGIMKGNEEELYPNLKGLHVNILQCGEYVIITIHDISFIEPYPYLITVDELNQEFDLTKYFFVTWSKDLKLLNMKKVLRINSEFNIEVLRVFNYNYFINNNMYLLDYDIGDLDDILSSNLSLSDYAPLPVKVVEGDIANDYWKTLINNVISKFGFNITVNTVDTDIPYTLFKNKDYSELDEYLNMKKAKYTSYGTENQI